MDRALTTTRPFESISKVMTGERYDEKEITEQGWLQ
jgi:hypothetical protein